jgi:hypothetical protein
MQRNWPAVGFTGEGDPWRGGYGSGRVARNLELEGGGQGRRRRRETMTGFEDRGRERSGGQMPVSL